MWCNRRGEVHKVFGPMSRLAPAKSLRTVPPRCRGANSARKSRARSTQLVQEQLKAATLLTANLGTLQVSESSGKEPDKTKSAGRRWQCRRFRRRQRRAIELLPVEPRSRSMGSPDAKSIIRNACSDDDGLHLHSRCNRNRPRSQAASTM